MQQALLDHLRKITEEEQRILDGVAEVDKDLYTSGKDFTVDSAKMLSEGKLIAVRTHTRFVHFPSHRHNFIEVLYVCQGQLTNIIGGKEVVLRQGELLFLNQFTRHEILPAGEEDIAINFMILPEFFDVAYTMAGNNNVLADFLVNVLRQDDERGEYLHFKVAEVLQIQNLLENMIYSLVTGKGDQNRINQTTMGLIFLYLLESVLLRDTRLIIDLQRFQAQLQHPVGVVLLTGNLLYNGGGQASVYLVGVFFLIAEIIQAAVNVLNLRFFAFCFVYFCHIILRPPPSFQSARSRSH